MPRGRPRRVERETIELSEEDINEMFRERVCSKYLRDRMWDLLKSKNVKIDCSICMETITQSCGYLLLVCGHDQVCAGCYQYMNEPKICPLCRN